MDSSVSWRLKSRTLVCVRGRLPRTIMFHRAAHHIPIFVRPQLVVSSSPLSPVFTLSLSPSCHCFIFPISFALLLSAFNIRMISFIRLSFHSHLFVLTEPNWLTVFGLIGIIFLLSLLSIISIVTFCLGS